MEGEGPQGRETRWESGRLVRARRKEGPGPRTGKRPSEARRGAGAPGLGCGRCEGCGNEGDHRQPAPGFSAPVSRTRVVALTAVWAPS